MGSLVGGSGKKGEDEYAPNLDPILQQQLGNSQAIFGATSPLLGGLSAQYMNLLGIPSTTGGTVGVPGYAGGTVGAPGSLLPANPGTGVQDLSVAQTVDPTAALNMTSQLDAASTKLDAPFDNRVDDVTATLFDPTRALGLADQFTALPDNVSQFGAAKELAEAQFARARDDALASIGGAGGSGAINATIGQLANDRAVGLSQTFADLAANEAAARGAGFDRAIGIEQGNAAALNNTALFNENMDFNIANQISSQRFAEDQANLDRSLTALQNSANTQNQINQNNIDRAIGIATGGTNMAMTGLGNAGSLAYNQGALAQQQNASNSAKKTGTGSAIGNVIAAGKLG